LILPLAQAPAAQACSQPSRWAIAGAFDLAANGVKVVDSTAVPGPTGPTTVPPSLLKAIGWVESNWQQYTPQDRPLLSFDFGYGIMQITSGMAGAFGNLTGTLDPSVQSKIAGDFRYNIAVGARILEGKWASVPKIGGGDSAAIEDWYYAIWAYNGWGWVNNPTNPRFARIGTPATNPSTYPYQERVLYLVAHPPRDSDGNPLWQPIAVTLPSRSAIGTHPSGFVPKHTHRQPVASLDAVYQSSALHPLAPSAGESIAVQATNTGTQPWLATGDQATQLTYHLFTTTGNPWQLFSPFSNGVIAYGQSPAPFPHDVAPGKSVTVSMTIRAPAQPGRYRVAWDLQRGASQWLSQIGVLPRARVLNVEISPPPVKPAATPTPFAVPEDLKFVADTSIGDGTQLHTRQQFQKGWLVFNDGGGAWGAGDALVETSGAYFGKRRIPVPVTNPCRTVNIIGSLRAPKTGGHYKTVWRMQDAKGVRFGEKLTLVVVVNGSGPPPKPTPTPTQAPIGTPTPTPTPVG
jgi:Ig-like domain from next to BRCA1 gene/Transglycosylase SLT domain